MTPPEGINCPDDKVLRLHKSIYGLKQSSRCWQLKLNEILGELGMKPTHSDSSFYVGQFNGFKVLMMIYVDDAIAASTEESCLCQLTTAIGHEIKIKIVESEYFVGFEIDRNENGILLHQTSYSNQTLSKYKMLDCKISNTPLLDINDLLTVSTDDTKVNAPYRELIGALNYISCLTRPNITFAVNTLAKFNASPAEKHWVAAKSILRYLKGSKSLGINFKRTDDCLSISCYSDSDWGGDPITRRSINGVLLEICNAPIIYRSKQQSIIATSTTESEFIAANQATKELNWLNSLLTELGMTTSNTIYLDNQAALRSIESSEYNQRTKHLDIKLKTIQEQYKRGQFSLKYTPTHLQKADILTKPLPPNKHHNMVNLLGLRSSKLATTLLLISIIGLSYGQFQHEDSIIWKPTNIIHIEGNQDILFKFTFIDPCPFLFNNITGYPYIDDELIITCSARYAKDISDTLRLISKTHNIVRREPVTVTIIAMSALYVATYSAIKTSNKVNRDIEARKEMETLLQTRITNLQEKFITAMGRIDDRIKSNEIDIAVLGDIISIQPRLNDALTQAIMQMHDDKKILMSLNRTLKVGGPIPPSLLELFNMTQMASPDTIKHIKLVSTSIKDNEILVRIMMPIISDNTMVMKAEAFSYRQIESGQVCDMQYVGPEYVLFNKGQNCVRALSKGEVVDDTVIGRGCMKSNTLKSIELYETANCRKVAGINITRPNVQFLHDGQKLRINCQEHFIYINDQKHACPNYVFSLENQTSFTIDKFSYQYLKTNITSSLLFEVPEHINLHFHASKPEFHALTAEEISELEETGKKKLSDERTDNVTDDDGWSFFSDIIGIIDSNMKRAGAYLGLAVGAYVLYLICRPLCYRKRPEQTRPSAPTAIPLLVMALLTCPIFVSATTTRHLRIHYTAEEASREIANLQQDMILKKCNLWDLSADYDIWMHKEGQYAVSLSCSLAKLKINCPCSASDEYIPVVSENKLRNVYDFVNTDCPTQDKISTYVQELDLFETATTYLCENAHLDSWSREHYGQLIASACILSKKAYNCHCHGSRPHKHIYRDLLTIHATDVNLTRRAEECQRQEVQLFSNRLLYDNTIYAKFHGRKLTNQTKIINNS